MELSQRRRSPKLKDASIGLVEDPEIKHAFLWVKRRDIPIWVLPGGGIDSGETAEEAVIREVLEESGLVVSIERKAAVYSPVNRWTATTHLFFCKWKEGKLQKGDESQDLQFFPIDSPPYPCFPLHVKWMREALDHPNQIIKRPLDEFKWWKVALFFLKHPIILLKYFWRS